MRNFMFNLIALVFLCQIVNGQTKYDSLWKKADDLLMNKGLPKSALVEVNKIYLLAKKENNEAQLIKALVYQINLRESGAENGNIKAIEALEKEVALSRSPATRAILTSVLAQGYWNYFQNNRWKLYNRTVTVGFKKDDLATWGIADFHSYITRLYMRSLGEEKLLKATKLAGYDPIMNKGNMRRLRPTLYDLLANRALEYFRNDERDVTKPAYAFVINQASAFDPAADFFSRKFVTQDSSSMQHKALLLYQKLVAFHLYDEQPDALIDIDLQRLEFVYSNAVINNKEALYFMAIHHVAEQYQHTPAAAQAWYLMARWHADKARKYNALKDTAGRYAYNIAEAICNKVLLQKEESEGKTNCYNLLTEIRTREINATIEKVNLPAQPFRSLVKYRNITQLYLRVILIEDGWINDATINRYDEKYWGKIVSLKPLKVWSQPLPDTRDHQHHTAEIKIDALPVGKYLVIGSAEKDFTLNRNTMTAQFIYVSSISFINNGNEYFALHRETGKPLAGASVQVWNDYYDYKTRTKNNAKAEILKADNKGYFKLNNVKDRNGIKIEVNYENDHLFLDDNFYAVYRSDQNTDSADYEKDNTKAFLFTDRSIYRPGQTMYFKGIAITRDFITGKSKIITGKKAKVFLNNANGEQIDSLELVTNAFGSYSGTFRLPENLLNGEFSLEDNDMNGNAPFSVEEYKRPRFYVEYEKLKGTYKVNDSISITGSAKAYAGNNIDGATVKYRVVRQPRFIYPWLWGRWGRPSTNEMEITNGTATTDGDGKFIIRFKAMPDQTLDKALDPVFNYNVIADITDNNGETRSGTTDVSVSYKALQLKIDLPEGASMPADSLRQLLITTQNTNNEFVAASVQVRLYKLQQPDRLIRKRSWEQPDQFVMSSAAYSSLFPHDEYDNETSKENWPRGAQVVERTDSSTSDKNFMIPNKGFAPGWYLVEASTHDKYGALVKDVQYIQLYNEKSNELPAKEYFTFTVNKNYVQPGEKASFLLGSSTNLFIIEQVLRGATDDIQHPASSEINLLKLDNETKTLQYPASESDRGGIGVSYLFVKDNRFYTFSNTILVPFTNKELSVSYETYRDKTVPGSEEKWKLKLSGSKKEKLAAEMLVSMYDASLDQFKPHNWNLPDVWRTHSYYVNWNSHSSFGNTESFLLIKGDPYKSLVKTYDELAISLSMANLQAIRSMKSAPGIVSDELIVRRELTDAASSFTIKEQNTLPSGGGDPLHIIDRVQEAVQVRKNFNETAFFFPELHTDEANNISFSFTVPEALTKWKFQGMAHTKNLELGYTTATLVTQKELMVQPNAPRFVREGDRMMLSTKIVNLSNKELTGTIELQLLDAVNMKPVDGIFHNMNASQYFTIDAGKSVAANFTIEVPYQYNSTLLYRFIARSRADSAGNITSDGEEAALAVLTNSMLVTESMPLPVRGNNVEKNFSFTRLLQSGSSETLKHYGLTVEFTSNPAWNAVQALPYLAEYPYECAEQTFNRFYANALASMIANSSPRLKQVFERWATTDTTALLSNLQKNAALKSVLLEETPWVLAAKTESQQKKNLALLFNMMRMEKELNRSLEKLVKMQSPNGGFVWFKGGPDDRFITQYIISGIGHLKKLNALPAFAVSKINNIVKTAIPYLDARMKEDYEKLVASKTVISNNHLSYAQVQFLYTRSFFPESGIPGASLKAISYYRSQSQKFWLTQSRYMQGMIALQLFRTGDKNTADAILKSLKEKAVVNEETGMYWADNISGYFWYQAPIETQSLLIEAFTEISRNEKITGDLKTWLLKQKQTQNWHTTKATADACYALLLQGSNWLTEDPDVTIKLGDKIINSREVNKEEGTGYFKTSIEPASIKPAMGNISVKLSSSNTTTAMPAWGAVYWQYFENLDKITSAATPLKLDKKLFVEKNSDRGPILEPVREGQLIKKGDKIKVRIELRADRDMEYVHMKDMRASCMEPVNVLSGYKWQGALGYYETTKDASTSFFFNRLPKGTHVFEYSLFANMAGNFSNGITTIQCMYAPEFSSHSEGIRVNVE